MEKLVKLFYEWEIQLPVLLSFAIQTFLFFTGGLRRCSTNVLLRLSIWIAYLGADTLAVYALGYLARHEDAHPLAFFSAPFLLIHLGGQDTITAFAMEDNNLWLRHLLNLVVQVVLAVYVFWMSIGRDNTELLVLGIFVFLVGIIKYGERIWSLRCGGCEILEDSPGNQYEHRLPEVIDGDTSYSNVVCMGLHTMGFVFIFFVSRGLEIHSREDPREERGVLNKWLKVLEIELGVIYDDLYTKALMLRTRCGVILRCISQICTMVALIVFLSSDRGRYSRVDIAITYLLFIGGLFLEVCAVISLMASPWTWEWFNARNYGKLAWFSWFIFSSDLIGWAEKRPLWSNAMGQYNLRDWCVGSEQSRQRSFNKKSMAVARKLATLAGV